MQSPGNSRSFGSIQHQAGGERELLMTLIPGTVSNISQMQCPTGVEKHQWIITHAVESYDKGVQLFQLLSDECTCPEMTAGEFKYMWREDGRIDRQAQAVSKPAKEYMQLTLDWAHGQLRDEKVCPKEKMAIPANFNDLMKAIFRRLYRVYAHMFYNHFQSVLKKGAKSASFVKDSFTKFVLFVAEFSLIDEAELKPLWPIVQKIAGEVFENQTQREIYFKKIHLIQDLVSKCSKDTEKAHTQCQEILDILMLNPVNWDAMDAKTKAGNANVLELLHLLLEKAKLADGWDAVQKLENKKCNEGHKNRPKEFDTWCAGKQWNLIAQFFIREANELLPRLEKALKQINAASLVKSMKDIEDGKVFTLMGPIKEEERAVEKYTSEDGKKEVAQVVMDYLRLTLIYPHLERAVEGYKTVKANPQFREVFFKNKYVPDGNTPASAAATPSAQSPKEEKKSFPTPKGSLEKKDQFPTQPCCLHAYFMFEERMVIEIMFMTADFVQAKELQHKFYEVQRSLELREKQGKRADFVMPNPWKECMDVNNKITEDKHGHGPVPKEKMMKAAATGFSKLINQKHQGETALMRHSLLGTLEVVEFLIAAKVDVNAKNGRGETALITAASKGQTDVVRVLLVAGADARPVTVSGKNARQLAEAGNYPAIVSLLSPAGSA